MLTNTKIGAFAAIKDPGRAREFYENTLGLIFVADEHYALVFDAGGTPLRLQKVQEVINVPYTVLGWRVEDIKATAAALKGNGVNFEKIPGFPQDDIGIVTFPNGAKVAWFKDPDGNTLSLDQQPAASM
jgi:catechol 2,3-dioxygenase-like lactoylglutathione lyase family enzyme